MSDRPKRKGRRLLALVGGVLVLVVLAVALLPTLVSLGLFRSAIEGAIGDSINGTAEVGTLKVGWLGEQRIRDLVIRDEQGTQVARLDATVDGGLLALLAQLPDPLRVNVGGDVSVERRKDGSINVIGLLPPSEDDEPAGAIPHVAVAIERARIDVIDRQNDVTIELHDLTGDLDVGSGVPLVMSLDGTTRSGDVEGSIELRGRADNLFAAAGGMQLDGASADFELRVNSIPVPFLAPPSLLRSFELTAASEDLGRSMEANLEAEAVLAEGEPSTASGAFTIEPGRGPDGAPAFGLDSVHGRLVAQRLPTAVLQPFIDQSDLPIDLARDLGPLADITASIADDASGAIEIDVEAAQASLRASARLDEAAEVVRGEMFVLDVRVRPELLLALTGFTSDAAIPLAFSLDRFELPARETRNLGRWAAAGALTLDGPATLRRGDEPGAITLERMRLELATDRLAEALQLRGGGLVNGAELVIDETITALFDDEGATRPDRAMASGFIELRKLSAALAEPWIPEHVDVVRTLIGNDATLRLETEPEGEDLRARATFAGRSTAELRARRRGTSLVVDGLTAQMNVRPKTVELLQGDAAQPERLVEPARIDIQVDPFEIAHALDPEETAELPPVSGRVEIPQVLAELAPSMTAPLELAAFSCPFTIDPRGAMSLAATPTGTLHRAAGGPRIGELRGDANLADLRETPGGTIELTLGTLALAEIEALFARDAGSLSAWTGEGGDVHLTARGDGGTWRTSLDLELPQLHGRLEADLLEDALEVRSSQINATLSRALVTSLLAPETGAGALAATADLPLVVQVPGFRVPLAVLSNEPVGDAPFTLDASARGGPLELASGATRIAMRDLDVRLESAGLTEGVGFTVTAASASGDTPGSIDLRGALQALLDAEGLFAPEAGRLQLDGTVVSLPTALLDAMLDLEGLLVAAVGPTMNATLKAKDFSKEAGRFTTRIETPNGWLEGQVRGRENALRIPGKQPLTAELAVTQPLRERLLRRLHPILADIRTTKEPLRASVAGAVLPLDDDLSRLRADLEITIGDVELDSGSLTLMALRLAGRSGQPMYPGHIEPITAKIRNGVLTYERFEMRVGEYSLAYSGKVNLVTGRVDLRTEAPLGWLAGSIKELRGYEDKIVVPLVTRGSTEDYRVEVDPDFDLGKAALEAGFTGGIQQLLGDDPLQKLFGGKKRKKDGG